jgi:hypothetical protein
LTAVDGKERAGGTRRVGAFKANDLPGQRMGTTCSRNNSVCMAGACRGTINSYSAGPFQCLQNSCSTTELRRPALRQFTRPVVNSTGTPRELTGTAKPDVAPATALANLRDVTVIPRGCWTSRVRLVMLSTPEILGVLLLVVIGGSGLVAWRLRLRGKGPTARQFGIQWLVFLAVIGFTALNWIPPIGLLSILIVYVLVGVPVAAWIFMRRRSA